jgi:hypothetical protein
MAAATDDDEDDARETEAAVLVLVVKVTGMSSVTTKELALVVTDVTPTMAAAGDVPCATCRGCGWWCRMVVDRVVSDEAGRIKKLLPSRQSSSMGFRCFNGSSTLGCSRLVCMCIVVCWAVAVAVAAPSETLSLDWTLGRGGDSG